jgi:hypothetical protein
MGDGHLDVKECRVQLISPSSLFKRFSIIVRIIIGVVREEKRGKK